MTLNCDLIRSNSAGLNSLAPQFKGVPEDRHDRPILGTNHMVHADGVPEHDIGLVDRSICLGPGGKALSRGAEGRVITGGVTFVVAVWRDPQIMVNETGTLPGIVVIATTAGEVFGRGIRNIGPKRKDCRPPTTSRSQRITSACTPNSNTWN